MDRNFVRIRFYTVITLRPQFKIQFIYSIIGLSVSLTKSTHVHLLNYKPNIAANAIHP